MLLDAKKIKEDKEKRKQRENRRTVRRNLAVEKKADQAKTKTRHQCTKCQEKKERITRIIQKITPHVHIVEIVTTVLKMKSQKMIGCLVFHVASGCMKPVLSNQV